MGAGPEWDAVVVGAGLGGLSTAAFLATNGQRVLVLEHNQVVGGCSQVFRRRGRYEFDVGVHYIGECEPGGKVQTLLGALGLAGRVEFERLDPEGFSTITVHEAAEQPDEPMRVSMRVPRGWAAYAGRLAATFPDEEDQLRRCVDVLHKVAHGNPVAMARWGLRPLDRLFDSCRLSQPARTVIAGESGDYSCPPSRTPVAMHAGFLDHYLKSGAYYPRGGGQVIAAWLTQTIQAHGGTVRTKAGVRRILIEDGRAVGVELADGEQVRASVVVSNADLRRTYLELVGPEHLPARLRRRVERMRMALPLFTVYLAVDFDVRERFTNSTQWIYPNPDIEQMYADAYAGRIGGPVPVFMTSGTLKDPTGTHTAPAGQSTLELVTIAPAQHSSWYVGAGPVAGEHYSQYDGYQRVKERLTESVLDTASLVIEDLREHIVFCEASTPITQERFTWSTAGAVYGLEMTANQIGPFRPDVRSPIPGLYLAGAGTRYMHGIVSTINGGAGTAGAILGRNLIAEMKAGEVYGDPSLIPPDGEDWDPLAVSKPSSPLRKASVRPSEVTR